MAARAEGFAQVRAAAVDMIIQRRGWCKLSGWVNVERRTERTDIKLQRGADSASAERYLRIATLYHGAMVHASMQCKNPLGRNHAVCTGR